MSPIPSSLLILSGLTILVSLGYVIFGVSIYRQYDQIGVRGLSLFSVVWGLNFMVSSIVLYFLASTGIQTGTNLVGISFSRNLEYLLIGSTPLRGLLTISGIFAWFWFVYEYTTQASRRDELLIFAISAVLVAVATLNGLVGALVAFGYIQLPTALRAGFFPFANLLEILGTGIAIGVGVAQLFRTARRHSPFARGAAAALTLPIVFPYLLRYLYQFGIVPQFQRIQSLRLIALSLGLGGCLLATKHYRLFDQLPAAQAIGRQTSFDTVNTAITVLDDKHRVSDLNTSAEALFGVTKDEVIGRPIGELAPRGATQESLVDTGGLTFELASGAVVEAETTVTTDDRGREFGRVIVYKDITQERRRQQRIQVLNRVLRHNLRNRLAVVHGQIDALSHGSEPLDEDVSKVKVTLDDLVEMGSKAGKIENILQADISVDSKRPVADIVRMAVDDLEQEYGPMNVDIVASSSVTTTANPFILESIFVELIENTIEHAGDTSPAVEVLEDGSGIVVRDSGPGIPDDEIEVFTTGEETPLQHGSGLGLWLVKWGVERLGGDVQFETGDTGTQIMVSLPPALLHGQDSAPKTASA